MSIIKSIFFDLIVYKKDISEYYMIINEYDYLIRGFVVGNSLEYIEINL